jgi:hypothetical protein
MCQFSYTTHHCSIAGERLVISRRARGKYDLLICDGIKKSCALYVDGVGWLCMRVAKLGGSHRDDNSGHPQMEALGNYLKGHVCDALHILPSLGVSLPSSSPCIISACQVVVVHRQDGVVC